MIKSQKFDGERMALYPNLDYKQLYNALTQLMDVVCVVHVGLAGKFSLLWRGHILEQKNWKKNDFYDTAFGQALLQCLACLMPFLEHDLLDNMPYFTASTISILPVELHQEIVNYLCFYILPFTISTISQWMCKTYYTRKYKWVCFLIKETKWYNKIRDFHVKTLKIVWHIQKSGLEKTSKKDVCLCVRVCWGFKKIQKVFISRWSRSILFFIIISIEIVSRIKGSFSCKRGFSLLNFERGLKKTMGCLILKLHVVIILY